MAAVPAADPRQPSIYGTRFVSLLVIVVLGFGSNAIIQPILPLLILDRGGDATLVGIVFLAFAVPSVVLRPFIGRAVDSWSRIGVFFWGTLAVGLSCLAYLAPGLATILAGRVAHGAAWAGFNTGGNSTLYELAPVARRGEAAGLYSLMPGVSNMVLPGIGLVLLGWFGFVAPFVVATAFGVTAAVLIAVAPIPRSQPPAPPRAAGGRFASLIERRAVVPMLIEFLWTSANTLFFVYPALFVVGLGLPVTDLAGYYPIVGLVLIVTRLTMGRRVDRYARGRVVAVGATLGIVALLIAAGASTVAQLTVAGAVYAAATTATSPIASAMAMDRADPARRGAAMATYSLGYQLGIGGGAALWGFVIARAGFPAPYLLAIGAMVGLLGLLWVDRASFFTPPVRAAADG